MCSRLLKHQAKHGAIFNATERMFTALNRGYRAVLSVTLKQRWIVVLIFIVALALMIHLFRGLKDELSPLEDRGFFITVIVAPDGATLKYTDEYTRTIEKFFAAVPEIQSYFMYSHQSLRK
jgi:multidrug efflux pump